MRYGPEIVDKILAELEKVPNIRHVCNKVGIDHSTFYRWMGGHFKFHKAVELSLTIGREKMNDAAESVILTGIQNNDYRSATYWLSHNNERYIGVERVRYFQYLEKHKLEFLRRRKDEDPIYASLFHHYFELETSLDKGIADMQMRNLLVAVFYGETAKINNFIAEYQEWKRREKKAPDAPG